jgi:hypothetical protein
MWLHMALLSAMTSTCVLVHADDRIIRKNKGSDFRADRTLTAGKLEDLWEKEAALAEREAERLLQMGGDMSFFPTRPPVRPPTRAPTRAPIDQPTLAPTRATFDPTPSGTFDPTPSGTSLQPTPNNSCLLGRTRTEFLFDELSLITNPSLLNDPTTPQGRAFNFMVTDPLMPDVCNFPTIDQRYGLATFYFSTNGVDWTQDTGWLGNSQECDWFGITCVDGINLTDLLLRK